MTQPNPEWFDKTIKVDTPPLDDFLRAYREDDTIWWRMGGGHQKNLFDAALAALDACRDSLSG